MQLSHSVLSAIVIACAGTSASAALVTIGGNFAGSFGDTGPLAINSQGSTFINGSIGDASFNGVVNAANFDDGCNVILTLTQFAFTSTRNGPVTLSVTIIQDYSVQAAAAWTGSHQLNGDANFTAPGQLASINVVSTHETTSLPELQQIEVAGGPGTVVINRGQGPTTVVTPFDTTYRISTTYTMTLNANGTGMVTLNLPDSGVDQASCVPIPVPSAGVCLVGLLGVAGARRRRR